MKYINHLILFITTLFIPIGYSNTLNDFWQIETNIYIEVDEYKGQTNASGKKVFDKISTVGKLALTNPTSPWRFLLEHRESLRNHGRNLSQSRDAYIRSRTQIGVTWQYQHTEKLNFSLNASYRKESNDSVPNTTARGSNKLYWVIPSGTYHFNSTWSFNFWTAFQYYSRFYDSNIYGIETEYGITYRHSKYIKPRLAFYNDKLWGHNFKTLYYQDQIRGYLPIVINKAWSISPYFRYYLNQRTYNDKQLIQKIKSGYRIGSEITYRFTPKLTFWGSLALEPTTWMNPKMNNITYGNNNKQLLYLMQIGVKYRW